jgi:hypothetical protein
LQGQQGKGRFSGRSEKGEVMGIFSRILGLDAIDEEFLKEQEKRDAEDKRQEDLRRRRVAAGFPLHRIDVNEAITILCERIAELEKK